MDAETEKAYWHIRNGGSGLYEQLNGLIAVWGKEAVPFLDGMITNDVKTLEDGQQMLAAFPNAQGRLLAVARILRQGDKFLIETEWDTKNKVFQNLFRFTFAGDFFVEDISEHFSQTTIWNSAGFSFTRYSAPVERAAGLLSYRGVEWLTLPSIGGGEIDTWIPATQVQEDFLGEFHDSLGAIRVPDDVYEVLRIERGITKYGVDMDETTVVPELGLDGLISYNKGCYIGQEIIARIHFRGHVAKQLTGLVLSEFVEAGTELQTAEAKPAGRVTSVTYSPALEKTIALGFVRYDNLAKDTKLRAGETGTTVVGLPFEF